MADVQQELWNAFRSQPSEATFRPLYESTRALVYTLCQRILRHEEDAQDAFQAVYCRLLELARDGEKARAAAPVENIVYRLAVREADNLRKRRRRRSLKEVAMGAAYLPGAQLTPERIAADRQLREIVERLVEALPERYRLPLQLHYFHGRSHREVARILGKPTGTVSVSISRALRKLDPALRRAGLQHAPVILGAFLAGAQLISPPSAFSASIVFAHAKAATLAGGTMTATASVASTSTNIAAGVALMKTKAVTISIAVALGALALFTFGVTRRPPPETPAQVAQAPAAVPEPEPTAAESAAEAPAAPESQAAPAAAGEPRPVLRGIVVDALTGAPVADAKVWRKSGPGGWPSVVTGEDVRFELRAPGSGRYELQAWSRTHVASTQHVTVGERGEHRCRFELEPGFEVDVLVVDRDERPIEGARVYGQPTIVSENTGADGRARVGAIRRDGRHDLYASKDGYGFAGAFQPVFEPDEPVGHVTIVLESRASVVYFVFEGHVTDADGKPVAGADVAWGWPSTPSLLNLSDKTKTDEAGDFGALRARVAMDPPGTPRPTNIWLFLFQPGAEDRLSSVVVRSKSPDVTVAAINAGTCLLEAHASAFRGEPRRVPVTIVPGEEATVELSLLPTGVVGGQVTDASVPEKKVPPRRVTLTGQGARRVLESGKSARGSGQAGDRLKENWYSFSDLKKGTYQVRVEADGYRAVEYSIDVTPGLYELPRKVELEPERGGEAR